MPNTNHCGHQLNQTQVDANLPHRNVPNVSIERNQDEIDHVETVTRRRYPRNIGQVLVSPYIVHSVVMVYAHACLKVDTALNVASSV